MILTSAISDLTTASTTLEPAKTTPTAATSNNVFVALATDAPPPQIKINNVHPVAPLGINSNGNPIETNKFYANFFLGNQDEATWTHPYSVRWSKGTTSSWGLSVSHIEQGQLTFGPGDPARYYINPLRIQSIIFSAVELGSSAVLTTDSLQGFSVNVNLASTSGALPLVSFPLVQGMGFVTGEYLGATPLLQSGVFFRTLTYVGPINDAATFKYRILLEDNTNWVLYVTPLSADGAPPFSLVDSSRIQGPAAFIGTIQVAKNPGSDDAEATYDASAGAYAVNATVSGSVDGSSGSYTLQWGKAGITSNKLLMFALAHHVQSFDDTTASAKTDILLQTTTKGVATAVVADQFIMVENDLPVDIGFAPWSPSLGSVGVLSDEAITAINDAAATELNEDINAQTNLNSMYFSGKVSKPTISTFLDTTANIWHRAWANLPPSYMLQMILRITQRWPLRDWRGSKMRSTSLSTIPRSTRLSTILPGRESCPQQASTEILALISAIPGTPFLLRLPSQKIADKTV